MGCGALVTSMPSRHGEGGVSTRKPSTGGQAIYGRFMRKKATSSEQAFFVAANTKGPQSSGFEKGNWAATSSRSWAERSSALSSASRDTWSRTWSLPSVMPEAASEDDSPGDTKHVGSSGSAVSVRPTPFLPSSRTDDELCTRNQIVAPAVSSTTSGPPTSCEASLQGSCSPPTSADSGSDGEDLHGCEPSPSSAVSSTTVPRWKSGEVDQAASYRLARCRSRPVPLGALAEPLAPHRSGAVELQATSLKPAVAEEWWHDHTTQGVEERCRSTSHLPSSQATNGGRRPIAREENISRISTESFDELLASSSVSVSCPARSSNQKMSDPEGSVYSTYSNSLVSLPSTDIAVEIETETVHESAATDSLPENTSRSHSEPPEDLVSTHGTEMSEPPDSAASWAAATSNLAEYSTYTEVASDDSDHYLSFMLERPFAGLETILEENDSDNDTGLKLPRSYSNTSFQARATSKRGQSGPLGDPVSRWPLSSPEPLSSELVRTSPCPEVDYWLEH